MGWAGWQAGCKRYSWLTEGGRLAGGGNRVPFDVSSIIRATLPGLCGSSLRGWGLLRPVTRCLEG